MPVALHPHLIKQANEKNIPLNAIHAVLARPGITYQSFSKRNGVRQPNLCRCGKQQEKWTGEAFGHKIVVAVNVCCNLAITVFADQVETEVRPDQRAKGVTGYVGRNGQWVRA
jgi:hypothetical protein